MALLDLFIRPMAFATLIASLRDPEAPDCAVVRADLDRLLDEAMAKALREHAGQAENALFAVCAFIDETLLGSSWPGRKEWMRHKLQQARFHTANAGEEFHIRMESLLKEEADSDTPSGDRREALEVFLACLNLGFRGAAENTGRVHDLIRHLLEKLYGPDAGPEERAFPEIYAAPSPASRATALKGLIRAFFLFGLPALLAAGLVLTSASLLSAFVRNWLQALSSTL